MYSDFLGIGLTDKSLTELERRIIRETSPYAVVLFGRNIADAGQLCDLVREVKSLARRPPIFMIDEEGGRVDRLRHLVRGLETVINLAGAFMRGLHETGTASCLKHFPGIGVGSADPHYGATVIDVGLEELTKRELVPFARLGNEAGAIMIGHGTYPQIDEPDLPATLSHRISTELLRDVAGFEGLAVTDDMEMHAVSDFGPYETITERSLLAGNDVVLFCSHIERVPDIQAFVREKSQRDAKFAERLREAAARAEKYRTHIDQLRRAAPPPMKSFDDVIDEAVRFVDRFEKTRPEGQVYEPAVDRRKESRSPGKCRTGREEWT